VRTTAQAAAVILKYLPSVVRITPPPSEEKNWSLFVTNLTREIAALKRNDVALAQQITAQNRGLEAKMGLPSCSS